MEKTEALKKIELLLPSIKEYQRTGQLPTSLTMEKLLILKDVWDQHYQVGGSKLCISCPGVIKEALVLVQAFYEREVKLLPKKEVKPTQQKEKKQNRKRGFLK